MKNFLTKLWEVLKGWAINTALPEFKKYWVQYVNILILFFAFVATKGLLHGVLGIWLAIFVIYYVLWRFFGLNKLFNTPTEDPQVVNPPAPPAPPTQPVETVKPVTAPRKRATKAKV